MSVKVIYPSFHLYFPIFNLMLPLFLNPVFVFSIVSVYLTLTLSYKYSRHDNKKEVIEITTLLSSKLRFFLTIYNTSQILFNMFLVILLLSEFQPSNMFWFNIIMTPKFHQIRKLHYLNKYIDLLDTMYYLEI